MEAALPLRLEGGGDNKQEGDVKKEKPDKKEGHDVKKMLGNKELREKHSDTGSRQRITEPEPHDPAALELEVLAAGEDHMARLLHACALVLDAEAGGGGSDGGGGGGGGGGDGRGNSGNDGAAGAVQPPAAPSLPPLPLPSLPPPPPPPATLASASRTKAQVCCRRAMCSLPAAITACSGAAAFVIFGGGSAAMAAASAIHHLQLEGGEVERLGLRSALSAVRILVTLAELLVGEYLILVVHLLRVTLLLLDASLLLVVAPLLRVQGSETSIAAAMAAAAAAFDTSAPSSGSSGTSIAAVAPAVAAVALDASAPNTGGSGTSIAEAAAAVLDASAPSASPSYVVEGVYTVIVGAKRTRGSPSQAFTSVHQPSHLCRRAKATTAAAHTCASRTVVGAAQQGCSARGEEVVAAVLKLDRRRRRRCGRRGARLRQLQLPLQVAAAAAAKDALPLDQAALDACSVLAAGLQERTAHYAALFEEKGHVLNSNAELECQLLLQLEAGGAQRLGLIRQVFNLALEFGVLIEHMSLLLKERGALRGALAELAEKAAASESIERCLVERHEIRLYSHDAELQRFKKYEKALSAVLPPASRERHCSTSDARDISSGDNAQPPPPPPSLPPLPPMHTQNSRCALDVAKRAELKAAMDGVSSTSSRSRSCASAPRAATSITTTAAAAAPRHDAAAGTGAAAAGCAVPTTSSGTSACGAAEAAEPLSAAAGGGASGTAAAAAAAAAASRDAAALSSDNVIERWLLRIAPAAALVQSVRHALAPKHTTCRRNELKALSDASTTAGASAPPNRYTSTCSSACLSPSGKAPTSRSMARATRGSASSRVTHPHPPWARSTSSVPQGGPRSTALTPSGAHLPSPLASVPAAGASRRCCCCCCCGGGGGGACRALPRHSQRLSASASSVTLAVCMRHRTARRGAPPLSEVAGLEVRAARASAAAAKPMIRARRITGRVSPSPQSSASRARSSQQRSSPPDVPQPLLPPADPACSLEAAPPLLRCDDVMQLAVHM
ncbi:hypothetical protein JKP88DRAFT_253769 [Tribonema minus]|uniref:Uncharacterized protein n=1 Tax=Tribonema minus TaxID=303371 RepID=A0A836CLL7_9STRA|nr:hypothetical protein JKP88DRAFT_253769 [Tribonema minus]